jgi:hypothetical protein
MPALTLLHKVIVIQFKQLVQKWRSLFNLRSPFFNSRLVLRLSMYA